jgi:hypothetical protein
MDFFKNKTNIDGSFVLDTKGNKIPLTYEYSNSTVPSDPTKLSSWDGKTFPTEAKSFNPATNWTTGITDPTTLHNQNLADISAAKTLYNNTSSQTTLNQGLLDIANRNKFNIPSSYNSASTLNEKNSILYNAISSSTQASENSISLFQKTNLITNDYITKITDATKLLTITPESTFLQNPLLTPAVLGVASGLTAVGAYAINQYPQSKVAVTPKEKTNPKNLITVGITAELGNSVANEYMKEDKATFQESYKQFYNNPDGDNAKIEDSINQFFYVINPSNTNTTKNVIYALNKNSRFKKTFS